jgi:hypothetical protein
MLRVNLLQLAHTKNISPCSFNAMLLGYQVEHVPPSDGVLKLGGAYIVGCG